MQMTGCDLHSRQQTLAILDTETGVLEERVLEHDGNNVRDFYRNLPRPARVGIEATGSMQWFLELMQRDGLGGLTRDCKVELRILVKVSGGDGVLRPWLQRCRSWF